MAGQVNPAIYALIMTENDKSPLSSFILKRRKQHNAAKIIPNICQESLPWFKRPLEKEEFMFKLGKDSKYYVRHKEWGKKIWIGPYETMDSVGAIIDSYVIESLKSSLEKKIDNKVHSVVIDDENEFFVH